MQRLRRFLPPAPLAGLQRHCFAGVVGFAGGATLGLVGWGGGQMIIPGMTHQYMALNQLAATGVSLFSLSLSSISSSVRFATSDSACLVTAASIAIPSIVTARFGTQLASRLSNDALEFAFNSLSLVMIPTHLYIQQRRHAQQLAQPPPPTSTGAAAAAAGAPAATGTPAAAGAPAAERLPLRRRSTARCTLTSHRHASGAGGETGHRWKI